MSTTRVPLPGVEINGNNAASGTFVRPTGCGGQTQPISRTQGLRGVTGPTFMSNAQKDILQIIRKEEDHLMSLFAASPLLSGLFLTYANRAAALDSLPIPPSINQELLEMKALNHRLQEEVASLRGQLSKGTDRDRESQDCIEALRTRLSSVEDTNRGLEATVLGGRAKLEAMASEYADYKKETTAAIAELRNARDKEVGVRVAPSQATVDQQKTLESSKEKAERPSPSPAVTQQRPESGGERKEQRSDVSTSEKGEEAVKQTGTRKQQVNSERPPGSKPRNDSKHGDRPDHSDEKEKKGKDAHGDPKESTKPACDPASAQDAKQSPWGGRKLQPSSIWFRETKARR